MTKSLEAKIQELSDRQEIYDCLMRYCRAIDRVDRALLETVYHPGAVDDHGDYVGPATGFIDWVMAAQPKDHHRSQHMILNHYCELEGDVAFAESYWLVRTVNTAGPPHTTASGRYVDQFEKRDGRWAVVSRICLIDILDEHFDPKGEFRDGPYGKSTRDRNDTSYKRPVTIDRARYTG
jgi:hypothetical protein